MLCLWNAAWDSEEVNALKLVNEKLFELLIKICPEKLFSKRPLAGIKAQQLDCELVELLHPGSFILAYAHGKRQVATLAWLDLLKVCLI